MSMASCASSFCFCSRSSMSMAFNGGCCLCLCVALLMAAMLAQKTEAALVKDEIVLKYHNGPVIASARMQVHLIWYGTFTASQRAIVADFVQSLRPQNANANANAKAETEPAVSVSTWWHTTNLYNELAAPTSAAAASVATSPPGSVLGRQVLLPDCPRGKSLLTADIAKIVLTQIKSGRLTAPAKGAESKDVYVVLTASDVAVEGFCMSKCGSHAHVRMAAAEAEAEGDVLLPVAWVGNPEKQCPGMCAWPFHQPLYGPQTTPLVAPNGDVGVDGMIISLATVVAGAATNPFNSGFFQGDRLAPLEAVSACAGMYGKGAYPGYPGELLVEPATGASYNALGVNGRRFLVPAMWDPSTRTCKTLV